MQSDNTRPVLLISGDFGLVEDFFDPTVLPRKFTSKGSLHTGGLYLRAALNEMHRILRLCEDLQENHRELLRETKAQYDNLDRQQKELELLEKRRSIFKPFKLVAIRRAKRAFRESAEELWASTKTTSDRLTRAVLSAPSADVAPVENDSLERDERIAGLVTELPPPGEMSAPATQEALAAAQRVASILASCGNPFADPTSSNNPTSTGGPALDPDALSFIRSSISSSPSSPGSASAFSYLNLNLNYNIVNNTDSNVPGFTLNNGSENGGSTTEHYSSANSSPPS